MNAQEKAETLASEYGRKATGEWVEFSIRPQGYKRGHIIVSDRMGGVLLVHEEIPAVNLSPSERERREEMGHVDPPNGAATLIAVLVEPTERETRGLAVQKAANRVATLRALAADDTRQEAALRDAMEAERIARAELAATGEK